eukprot:TRINITY_DN2408_c0_g2_i1.p1 TRINITY_DN2408_c0_g2~~TRINITY_DN2408_c0_g2_i1.p1  ORF type:complete len:343 (-),score=107.32 TRINITY_DN2408_c0_g2_i1:318-1268(-)
MAVSGARALHWVFKIASRKPTIHFYSLLGMIPLRHEEFEKGCEASCNGPYDGKWSKTMIGYGSEDNHFVIELTYNYGIKQYELGNDYQWITIKSKAAIENIKKENYPHTERNGVVSVNAPDGYQFKLINEDAEGKDPVQSVALHSSNLQRSLEFWEKTLGMKLLQKTTQGTGDEETTTAVLSFGEGQASLELIEKAKNKGEPINHAVAFGRIAFSVPRAVLPGIQDAIQKANYTILTPLISLDTPGKATVEVTILADPDGYEICFVGDEAFRELSRVDPNASKLLEEGIENDKSDEWFAKRAARLAAAAAAKSSNA